MENAAAGSAPSGSHTGQTWPREWHYRRVLENRDLTDSVYVLRFEKGDLEFLPGQYLSVGVRGESDMREYSIYSPADAPFLEILVKEVENGSVSRKLRSLVPGDEVYIEGPFGFFTIPDEMTGKPVVFVGTGTGISPFHSYALSMHGLDYQVYHGTRLADETFGHEDFAAARLVHCVSREAGQFNGRVTDIFRQLAASGGIDKEKLYFLCGNCDMIYEIYDILITAEVGARQIFAEVYF